MPSFQDSILLFFLALLLFGPKKLPELARQLGKLMAEFRRASNEFRMQMEDELRMSEQAEQQKKIAEMEAAAPVTPAITDGSENTIAPPDEEEPLEVHPHADPFTESNTESADEIDAENPQSETSEPLPIATSGSLNMMPPSTGLPVASASVSQAFRSIPRASESETPAAQPTTEATLHG
ncbi:MAG TPA: twin-arginine translocase TatA/TatE family subunit [Edaphobacter sp.]|nr:twin-arginine translocase TatA/TatE family subunit [Edaphobacter sp.]